MSTFLVVVIAPFRSNLLYFCLCCGTLHILSYMLTSHFAVDDASDRARSELSGCGIAAGRDGADIAIGTEEVML